MTGLGESQNATDHTYSTKDGDMYAFGVMTWEVWTDSFARCYSTHLLGAGSHGAATIP